MNNATFDGDELVAFLDEILDSLIGAIKVNDWVEAGRLNAAIHSIAKSLGVSDFSLPIFPLSDLRYLPLLPAPITDKSVKST